MTNDVVCSGRPGASAVRCNAHSERVDAGRLRHRINARLLGSAVRGSVVHRSAAHGSAVLDDGTLISPSRALPSRSVVMRQPRRDVTVTVGRRSWMQGRMGNSRGVAENASRRASVEEERRIGGYLDRRSVTGARCSLLVRVPPPLSVNATLHSLVGARHPSHLNPSHLGSSGSNLSGLDWTGSISCPAKFGRDETRRDN